MNRMRTGFTLLEVLVSISIILLLMGLVFIGFRSISTGQQVNQTKSTLGILDSVLNELAVKTQNLTAASVQPVEWPWNGEVTPAGLPYNFWAYPGQVGGEAEAITAPGNVAVRSDDRVGWQMLYTQQVYRYFRRLPATNTMISNLPKGSFATEPEIANPPLVVDAWDNPILFVPTSGLKGVKLEADVNPNDDSNPIKSPGGKPFFASAGPDGDFSKGDDNLYSFEN